MKQKTDRPGIIKDGVALLNTDIESLRNYKKNRLKMRAVFNLEHEIKSLREDVYQLKKQIEFLMKEKNKDGNS